MTKHLITSDAVMRTKTEMEFDGDNIIVHNSQDAEPIIEQNKRLYTLNDGYSRSRLTRRVAQIPMLVYLDLVKRGVTKDPKAFSRWLNDPDNRYFRTAPGRV